MALLAPPNTWHSMTYHMARVANWVQHRAVGHYQTPILRQLYLAPFSEFVITQLQILVGSDRLATLVHYFAMLGSLVGVTCIARTLSVSRRGQVLTALFVAALPIGVLEASSTQTDYVAAFWVVCFVNAGLTILFQPKDALRLTLFTFAAAAGLGFLTKSTTALFITPFAIWNIFSAALPIADAVFPIRRDKNLNDLAFIDRPIDFEEHSGSPARENTKHWILASQSMVH